MSNAPFNTLQSRRDVSETTALLSDSQVESAGRAYDGLGGSETISPQNGLRKLKGVAKLVDSSASSTSQGSVPGTPGGPTSKTHNDPGQSTSLWSSVLNSTSMRLENTGSVARDHLASERTFLAYIRTSLAIASSGVALVQLFSVAQSSSPPNHLANDPKMQGMVRPLGAVAILIGLSVLLIGVTRYFVVQSALTNGHFPAARTAMAYISLALAALVAATFSFLVTGQVGPSSPP